MQKNISSSNTLLDVKLILRKAGIETKMRVADFGCGISGHFVIPVAQMVGREGRVYAVDILKKVLGSVARIAKVENLLNVRMIWSDLEKFGATKIESSSLDVILLINTLHQANKKTELIREAVRCLKKNGKLVVVEWKKSDLPLGPANSEKVDLEYLKAIAQKTNLGIEEDFYAGEYHYGVIFSKL